MKFTLRGIVESILGSILAAAILGALALAWSYGKFERGPYLEVEILPETCDTWSISHVSVTNHAAFALYQVTFQGVTTRGRIVHAAYGAPGARHVILIPDAQTTAALWTGPLGRDQTMDFVVVVEGGELNQDPRAQFQGWHWAETRNGNRVSQPVYARTTTEANNTVLKFVICLLVAIVVLMSAFGTWWLRRMKAAAAQRAPAIS